MHPATLYAPPKRDALEKEMADFYGVGHAICFSTGYAATMGMTATLAGPGDVILLDAQTVLVGHHLRSNRRGFEFLEQYLSPLGYRVHAVPHRQLHLDCCLNPLGRGHMLMHRDSLYDLDAETEALLGRYDWISVDAVEREYLATNVLSIDPDTIIARDHPACARVNEALVARGYTVEAIEFDGVPATGGSFRCATMPLRRS